MELIPFIEEDLSLKGFGERKWVEKQNLCHLTTLLIPIVRQDGHSLIQIQIRDRRKSFPCCRDIFGGHVTVNQEFWPFLLGAPFDLSKIVIAAAVREANEELRVHKQNISHPYIITEKDLRQVGGIGEARWNGKGNVERSTIFLVPIRDDCVINPMDDIEGVFVPVETERVDWRILRSYFMNNKQYAYKDRERAKEAGCDQNKETWQFADGAARILKDETLFETVLAAVDALADDKFKSI
jgi:hypothetical protein